VDALISEWLIALPLWHIDAEKVGASIPLVLAGWAIQPAAPGCIAVSRERRVSSSVK